ncbi:hypothetical protein J3T65_03845 [Staphylococcus simiae]|uniref:hypothetical protein n=1 Tax=Staphylococcus simiae TaxID=308354 RepID=UPI001A9667F4|nr:hypothetical protein [Staphylococcus simiae]MBO1198661.1 hypothetical protein [Staphylococcus simiae]MBO1200854.1 hypothetical protein [Staphylococcus simiae]MBO1203062.1 hypothetical protein [Staphylococcus simiae]MBO1211287.1 hypothetical protein [Staphylococcus simiae]MBO1229190.1 hypothetical protein [Staphylococcus simiae]
MTEELQQHLQIELLDLFDDVKYELSEINAAKDLFINGPAHQILKRGTHMAYIQGQKQAIDNIMTLLELKLEDDEFLPRYDTLQQAITNANYKQTHQFAQLQDIPRQFDQFLTDLYNIKGQYFIITHINSIISDHV